ncbi:hypothetical protein D3C80_847400 [compost metagenome]
MGVQQFVVIGDLAPAEIGGDGVVGHFVVVGLNHQGSRRRWIPVGVEHGAGHGVMGDVVEEGVSGADRAKVVNAVNGHRRRGHGDQVDGVGRGSRDDDVVGGVGRAVRADPQDDLGVARDGIGNEAAIGVCAEQGDVEDVLIGQLDAQHGPGLGLDVAPGGQTARRAIQQVARGHSAPVHRRVFSQEDLMRSMGCIGLVLVDEGRGDVDRLVRRVVGSAHDPVGAGARHRGGAAKGHEGVLGADLVARARNAVSPVRAQGIIRRQGDIDGAVAGFGDQVQTMVEELAEEGHPTVEGRAQTFIRCDVGDDQRAVLGLQPLVVEHGLEIGLGCIARSLLGGRIQPGVGVDGDNRVDQGRMSGAHHGQITIDICGTGKGEGGDDGGRIVEAHVGDKVRDQPRIGVRDIARMAAVDAGRRPADRPVVVVGDALAAPQRHGVVALIDKIGVEQARHRLVCRAPVFAPLHDVIVAAVDRSQAEGRLGVGNGQRQGRIEAGRGVPGPISDDLAGGVQPDFGQRSAVRMSFGDLDLLQDEFQIMLIKRDHCSLQGENCLGGPTGGEARRGR